MGVCKQSMLSHAVWATVSTGGVVAALLLFKASEYGTRNVSEDVDRALEASDRYYDASQQGDATLMEKIKLKAMALALLQHARSLTNHDVFEASLAYNANRRIKHLRQQMVLLEKEMSATK